MKIEDTAEEAKLRDRGKLPPGWKARIKQPIGWGQWDATVTNADGFTWNPDVSPNLAEGETPRQALVRLCWERYDAQKAMRAKGYR